jgi:hypothetical protein
MLKTALFALIPAALFASYPYYTPGAYTPNGDTTFASASGGSQIATATVPAGATEYELRMTLNIKASGGTFLAYLRASSNAILGPTTAGTFYAVEFANVQINGASCSGTLTVYKTVNGSSTWLAGSTEPCRDGMTWRASRSVNWIVITSDLGTSVAVGDTDIAAGNPGYGAHDLAAGNGFASVSIGPADTAAPAVVNPLTVATSVASNQVDLQWQGVADDLSAANDHNGSGIWIYQIYRDGGWIANVSQPQFSDKTVVASTSYSYFIVGIDHFYNYSWSQAFPVHTPAAGGIDPRRTGVRSNGAYWGGGGEQIDLLSGNLNFTLPLLRAQGRGGWGVTFALNYNSTNFRKDTAATWKLGRDLGYGFGWKFLAGSLAEYRSGWYTVDHYLFTDSTGAEYRLNQQSGGIWYSQEGIYVRYDPAKNQLYFPDGSFWEFNAVSSGAEEDAGTMYPTKMQDSNGNFIALTYQTGTYAVEAQSSSRILTIEDARASSNVTYQFTYNTSPTPHLTYVAGPDAAYTFLITDNVALNSPFTGDSTTFGTTSRLDRITGAFGLQHNFTYNSNNSGELTKVTFPYGGSLAWQFRDFTFSDSRVIRDMQYRWLNDGVNGNLQYSFWHDDAHDYNTSNHYVTTVGDASGVATKQWTFDNATGLESSLWELGLNGGSWIVLRASNLYWLADSDGNRYISDSYSTIDPNTSPQIARTNQTRDNFGNLTQLKVYDYNNQITPSRTYNNTFRTDTVYTNRYIRNLLSTGTVTPTGTATIPLATNNYDQDNPCSNGTPSHAPPP